MVSKLLIEKWKLENSEFIKRRRNLIFLIIIWWIYQKMLKRSAKYYGKKLDAKLGIKVLKKR